MQDKREGSLRVPCGVTATGRADGIRKCRRFLCLVSEKSRGPHVSESIVYRGWKEVPMETQKHRVTFNEENYLLAAAIHKTYGFKNVSELINAALEEWIVRKTTQQASRYLSKEVAQIIEQTVGEMTRRINRMMFKLAVSDAEMKHVLAHAYSMDEDELRGLRPHCEQEVRIAQGLLPMEDVARDHQGDD